MEKDITFYGHLIGKKKSEKNTLKKKKMLVSLSPGFHMFSSFTKQIDFEMRS